MYSFCNSICLFKEPLHGITFGIFYSAAVTYISRAIANDGTQATFQGIFGGCFMIGKAMGSVGSGNSILILILFLLILFVLFCFVLFLFVLF